ncbi:MAG: type I methionyl aminopeptidase, partial [Rhodospirillales bacterium]
MNDQAEQVPSRDGRFIKIHDEADFEGMRKAGRLAAECLDFITPHVIPGMSTDELNILCHDWTLERKA